MKGDFTRDTFRPARRFTGVRLQQGRVQLDADWNEQADITAARIETGTRDTVGAAGGPLDAPAFAVVTDPTGLPAEVLAAFAGTLPLVAGDVLLTPGRYYVDGLLVENPTVVSFAGQPDLPGAAPLPEGRHLVYLDVFEQHVTFVEDAGIREVALGGPDTATRTRLVWQVRARPVDDAFTCLAGDAAWDVLLAGSTGRLAARAEPAVASADPCVVPASAGYRGLQNRLYRVEIHAGGTLATATFTWSRDNGTVLLPIEELNAGGANRIRLRSLGRDRDLALRVDDWVEVLDDARERAGTPGLLTRVTDVDNDDLILTLADPVSGIDLAAHAKIRRWDSAGAVPTGPRRWVALEDGIEVRFDAGSYRTGDHWLLPARTILGNPLLVDANGLEWPGAGGVPEALPPAGVRHHYARLAIVRRTGDTVVLEHDCRELFPPLAGLRQLDYASGDGQEAMPDLTQPAARVPLAEPLRVGVSNGRWPVAGARVRFRRLGAANGELVAPAAAQPAPDMPQSTEERTFLTGADGLASCGWRLDGARTRPVQQVEAVLLDAANAPVHLPVVFTANLSVAERVAYDPGPCPMLADARDVQRAIDLLATLAQLQYAGGDGQEAPPDEPLPAPLQVRVASPCGPVPGAEVRFETPDGGRVAAAPADLPGGGAAFVATTGADGVATAHWVLAAAAGAPEQQALTATLVPGRLHAGAFTTVTFHARVARGTEAAEPVIRVRRILLATGQPLQNDTFVSPAALAGGLLLSCDVAPDAASVVGKPVVALTVEVPEQLDGAAVVFRPVILDGLAVVEAREIIWRPRAAATATLLDRIAQAALRLDRRALVRLRVLGNFVWAADDRTRHLDGDLFGTPAQSGAGPVTGVRLPSGDGRRGGDLEMWFWLDRQVTEPNPPTPPTGPGPVVGPVVGPIAGPVVGGPIIGPREAPGRGRSGGRGRTRKER